MRRSGRRGVESWRHGVIEFGAAALGGDWGMGQGWEQGAGLV